MNNQFDAIIFDGGGRNDDGTLGILAKQRLDKVIELYKLGEAKK